MGPGANGTDGPQADAELLAQHLEAATKRESAEWQQAQVDKALQAGWSIRFDFMRMEYAATRELYTDRTIPGLLRKIKEAGGGS